ncbi:hypothetical protein [Bradyrhizobium sp. HKCCYLR20261]|uniref:hypothetical protein n=1 Tax=Bradyrhizobium sp. HKCCYLR20261 TaxID=3420760 RepID=UPI003EBC7F8B
MANEPGTGEIAKQPSTHRAGNAGVFRLCLWYLPPAFFSAGGPWVMLSPGIPCALCTFERDMMIDTSGTMCREIAATRSRLCRDH